MEKKLCKSRSDIKLDGVCAGIAQYFNWDVTIIRLLWVLMTLFTGGQGILIYIVCVFVMPREDYRDGDVHWEDKQN